MVYCPGFLLLIAPLLAAQPQLQNARAETRAVSGSLESTIRGIVNAQSDPAWIAYATPQVPGEHHLGGWPECVLQPQPVHLEGAPEFLVLYRIESKKIDRVRAVPADCTIDTSGLPFYWLTGVNAAQSVELLTSLTERRLANQSLSVIALHRDGVPALVEIARHGPEVGLRKQALFWLGRSKDPRAAKFFEEVLAIR